MLHLAVGLAASHSASAGEAAERTIRILKPTPDQTLQFGDKVQFEAEIGAGIDRVVWRIYDKNAPSTAFERESAIDASGGKRLARMEHEFLIGPKDLEIVIRATGSSPGGAQPQPQAELAQKLLHPAVVARIIVSPGPHGFMQPVQFRIDAPPEASVAWDFDDGSASSEANPVHTFERAGTYKVAASVKGKGERATVCQADVQVEAKPPRAAAKVLYEGQAAARVPLGGRIDLIDESSGDITGRMWLLDGEPVDPERRSVALQKPGRRTLLLRITGVPDRAGKAAQSEAGPIMVECEPVPGAAPWFAGVAVLGVLLIMLLFRRRPAR